MEELNIQEPDRTRITIKQWEEVEAYFKDTLDNYQEEIMIDNHLKLLGLKVKDRATKFEGIVQSICFDLFGCIQADVRPEELDKDGKVRD